MTIEIPLCLAELRRPWLKGADKELQKLIRFAAQEGLDGRVEVWNSGGDGTISKCIKLPPEKHLEFRQLASQEYLTQETSNPAEKPLREFLAERGVRLEVETTNNQACLLTTEVYKILPRHHFGHPHFGELKLGGWGRGAEKTSGHYDSEVHMFDFALVGPRRNYLGLLLHETGHAHYDNTDEQTKSKINQHYRTIGRYADADSSLTIDYLMGSDERWHSMKGCVDEFAAEFYLLYVVRGMSLLNMVQFMDPKVRDAWTELYVIFKESFKTDYKPPSNSQTKLL